MQADTFISSKKSPHPTAKTLKGLPILQESWTGREVDQKRAYDNYMVNYSTGCWYVFNVESDRTAASGFRTEEEARAAARKLSGRRKSNYERGVRYADPCPARKVKKAGSKKCLCREPNTHRDCFYCGYGLSDQICGRCKEAGIDGRVIRGTSRRTCKAHKA